MVCRNIVLKYVGYRRHSLDDAVGVVIIVVVIDFLRAVGDVICVCVACTRGFRAILGGLMHHGDLFLGYRHVIILSMVEIEIRRIDLIALPLGIA